MKCIAMTVTIDAADACIATVVFADYGFADNDQMHVIVRKLDGKVIKSFGFC